MAHPRGTESLPDKLSTLQVHGLSDLRTSRSVKAKMLWSTILIGMTTMFFVNLVSTIREFIINPTSTKVDIEPKNRLGIPPLLFCPVNAINPKRLEAAYPGAWHKAYRRIQSVSQAARLDYAGYRLGQNPTDEEGVDYTVAEFEELMSNVTYSSCELFLLIEHRGITYNCSDVVAKTLDRILDMCYWVDTGAVQVSNGFAEPLELYIHLPASNWTQNDKGLVSEMVQKFGPKVTVGMPLLNEFPARVIQPSSYTQLLVFSSNTATSPSRKQPCLRDSKAEALEYKFLSIGKIGTKAGYSRRRCYDEHLSATTWRECGCVPMQSASEWARTLRVCDMARMRSCAKEKSQLHEFLETASGCLPLCQTRDQTLDLNQVELSDAAYMKDHVREVGRYFQFRVHRSKSEHEDLVVISLRHGDMILTRMSQTNVLTFPRLVGTVGGILGLYLGASMFTVVQLLGIAAWALSKAAKTLRHEDHGEKMTETGLSTPRIGEPGIIIKKSGENQQKIFVIE